MIEKIAEKVEQRVKEISNDPKKFKEIFKKIDEDIAGIKDNKFMAGENRRVDLHLEGLQLLRLKHLELIYGSLFGLSEEEVIYYLINQGIFVKIYELGLLRSKIMDLSGQEEEN